MLTQTVFHLVVIATAVSATAYRDCGSTGHVKRLEVSGCKGSPCILRKGRKVALFAEFESDSSADSLEADVSGILGGVLTVPFKKDTQVCDRLISGKCGGGLKRGSSREMFRYVAQFTVPSGSPSIPVTAQWRIRDPAGNKIVCVKIPSQIQ